jgi:hypothetical protein
MNKLHREKMTTEKITENYNSSYTSTPQYIFTMVINEAQGYP